MVFLPWKSDPSNETHDKTLSFFFGQLLSHRLFSSTRGGRKHVRARQPFRPPAVLPVSLDFTSLSVGPRLPRPPTSPAHLLGRLEYSITYYLSNRGLVKKKKQKLFFFSFPGEVVFLPWKSDPSNETHDKTLSFFLANF